MKVALVHDWLTGIRGGEKVLEVLCELYPDADLHTLIHHRGSTSPVIEKMHIVESRLHSWFGANQHFRYYLPFFPRLIEQFDFSGYDLIVSSSHCVAKGAKTPENALHICYCHTPMRYVWDMYDEYRRERGPLVKAFLACNRTRLQKWDVRSADRVKHYIANSSHVAGRIQRHYGRDAEVIHPPVDTDFFTPGEGPEEDYYLIVSALVPYKRVGLAVHAFSNAGKRLVVIGTGSDADRIKNLGGPSVSFLGNVDDETLRYYYRGARALIFPGEEDFGITPLEAMACGKPVIAFGVGGATESVINGETGLFFEEPTGTALMAAVDNSERMQFTNAAARKRALEFSRPLFMNNIRDFIEQRYTEFQEETRSAQRA